MMANQIHSPSAVGLIIRQKEPVNLETPFDQVASHLTPTELFYIRSRFPAPSLEIASYQLRVDGAVRNPFSLSYPVVRDADRDIGVRRQWPGLPDPAGRRRTMGAWRRRQRRMDRRAPGSFARAR
jgi:hypothetical protein